MPDSFFKDSDSEIGQPNIPGLDDAIQDKTKEIESLKDQGAIASILAYIPFLCLIPLLQMRENEQARFHSKQGMLLFLIEMLAGIFLIPGLSSMIWRTILILALGASAAGIIFGLQGKSYKLPLIGDFAEKLKL